MASVRSLSIRAASSAATITAELRRRLRINRCSNESACVSGRIEPTGAQPYRLHIKLNKAHASENACAPVYDPRAYADGSDLKIDSTSSRASPRAPFRILADSRAFGRKL